MKMLINMIFVLFVGVNLNGQNPIELSFTRYSIADGLPNETMTVLGQDSTGFIWLSNPLTRFDGKNFKTFHEQKDIDSSPLISATSIFDDGQGNLFFSSLDGIYYFDADLQYVKKIPSTPFNDSFRKIIKTDSLTFWDCSRNNIYKIEMPNFDTTFIKNPFPGSLGQLYASNIDPKIWIFNLEKRVFSLDPNSLLLQEYNLIGFNDLLDARVVHDSKKNFWLISLCQGLWVFDKLKNEFEFIFDFKMLPNFDQLNCEIFSYQVGKDCWWIIDKKNNIVHRYDLNSKQISSIEANDDVTFAFKTNDFYRAIETSDSSLLLGTPQGGFFIVNPKVGLIEQYLPDINNTNSLASSYAVPEYEIDGSTFFICGIGQGLIKADLQKPIFASFIPPTSMYNSAYSKNIRTIIEKNDEMIVGSISEINVFNRVDKSFKSFPIPGNQPSPYPEFGAIDIALDKEDNLLVLHWKVAEKAALVYFDYVHNRVLDLTDYFPETSYYASKALLTDSKNNFWISAQSSVIKLNAEVLFNGQIDHIRDRATFYKFNSFRQNWNDVHSILAMTEDKNGDIWVGTNSDLYQINPNTDKITNYTNKPDDEYSLGSNDVRSIISTSEGQIWVGTNGGGLNKYKEENDNFERFSTQNGLPDNTIYTIAEDDSKKLWLGTNKGLCLFDPETHQSQQYTPIDGIQSYEFNTNAVCKTRDGWLAFGGINGFNLFSPEAISDYSTSKNLVFNSIKINNKEFPISSSSLDLSYNENFISFEFNLLDYYKNDKVQYAYKLDGLEKDWNYIRTAQKASYPGLNPGNYTFQVKAASHNGLWSESMLTIPLSIALPWWQTWWFILLSSISIAAIIYTFYKNKQNQKEKIIQLRNRISKDLHDEIGSTLSSISLFGTVAKKMANSDKEVTHQMLDRINDSTTQVMESMNDIVWAINSENDKVDNLIKRMRAFASELSDASKIRVVLDVDEKIIETSINMVQRRNVYLIFKEAVNNAFKYSKASLIKIKLNQINKKFQLSIIDDGIGFEKEKLSDSNTLGGNGLKNMAHRAEEMDGTLSVISNKNQGTEIRFIWNPNFEPILNNKK